MARIMKKNVNAEEMSVTFTFADGRSFTAKLENYSNEIVDRLALHGMAQKLGDSCAGKDDSDLFQGALKSFYIEKAVQDAF